MFRVLSLTYQHLRALSHCPKMLIQDQWLGKEGKELSNWHLLEVLQYRFPRAELPGTPDGGKCGLESWKKATENQSLVCLESRV